MTDVLLEYLQTSPPHFEEPSTLKFGAWLTPEVVTKQHFSRTGLVFHIGR